MGDVRRLAAGRPPPSSADSAAALDAMNVYPVADSDTGTNVRLTMARHRRGGGRGRPGRVDALVRGAILSAHGNSGAIVAEMMTSIARRLADQGEVPARGPARRPAAHRGDGRAPGGGPTGRGHHHHRGRGGRRRGRERPRTTRPAPPERWPRRRSGAAREALARTPSQLAVLAAAGVPDAGGQAYVLLLDALVEVLGGAPAEPLLATAPAAVDPADHGRPARRGVRGDVRAARREPRPTRSALSDRAVGAGS